METKNEYNSCKSNSCESCLMPFKNDPSNNNRENPKYCSLCFNHGKLCYEGDLKGFQKICFKQMRKNGFGYIKASVFAWMIRFAPRWKRK